MLVLFISSLLLLGVEFPVFLSKHLQDFKNLGLLGVVNHLNFLEVKELAEHVP